MGENLRRTFVRLFTLGVATGCIGLMMVGGAGCGNSKGDNPEVLTKRFPGEGAANSGGSKAPATTDGAGQK